MFDLIVLIPELNSGYILIISQNDSCVNLWISYFVT